VLTQAAKAIETEEIDASVSEPKRAAEESKPAKQQGDSGTTTAGWKIPISTPPIARAGAAPTDSQSRSFNKGPPQLLPDDMRVTSVVTSLW
jgi:hypothetical protein